MSLIRYLQLYLEVEAPHQKFEAPQSPRFHKTRYFSRHLTYAANDTALSTLRPIRPCFTANNKAYNPPTPLFHYANIAYATQFSNGLCYTHTQFSRIWFSVLQNASTSVYGCVLITTSAERQTLGTRGTHSWLDDTDKNFGPGSRLAITV